MAHQVEFHWFYGFMGLIGTVRESRESRDGRRGKRYPREANALFLPKQILFHRELNEQAHQSGGGVIRTGWGRISDCVGHVPAFPLADMSASGKAPTCRSSPVLNFNETSKEARPE